MQISCSNILPVFSVAVDENLRAGQQSGRACFIMGSQMKEIPLTHGKVAIVDDEDFDSLSKYKWYLHSDGYAARTSHNPDISKRRPLLMHRIINETHALMQTDHINGNRLDNRRSNLRTCTSRQNHWNTQSLRGRAKYKGVRIRKNKCNQFLAAIRFMGKDTYIGVFPVAEDAARAYDKKATDLFGEFARLNFPKGEKQ
jgi:hypothetical protein